jgi:hypothetical protein
MKSTSDKYAHDRIKKYNAKRKNTSWVLFQSASSEYTRHYNYFVKIDKPV